MNTNEHKYVIHTIIRNTILYFLVFHASFFNAAVVRLYLINGYIKKGKRLTLAAFASLATLALAALFF